MQGLRIRFWTGLEWRLGERGFDRFQGDLEEWVIFYIGKAWIFEVVGDWSGLRDGSEVSSGG